MKRSIYLALRKVLAFCLTAALLAGTFHIPARAGEPDVPLLENQSETNTLDNGLDDDLDLDDDPDNDLGNDDSDNNLDEDSLELLTDDDLLDLDEIMAYGAMAFSSIVADTCYVLFSGSNNAEWGGWGPAVALPSLWDWYGPHGYFELDEIKEMLVPDSSIRVTYTGTTPQLYVALDLDLDGEVRLSSSGISDGIAIYTYAQINGAIPIAGIGSLTVFGAGANVTVTKVELINPECDCGICNPTVICDCAECGCADCFPSDGKCGVCDICTIVWGDIPETLTANDVADAMGIGWNLGNTFDAHASPGSFADAAAADIPVIETAWMNAEDITTQSFIRKVKSLGFENIRIPVCWSKVADPADDWKINPHYMARVKQVVTWAYAAGFYIILNDHHQEDALNMNSGNSQIGVDYLTAIWTQVAGEFESFGERLIFEVMNEPRSRSSSGDIWGGGETQAHRIMINQYNQAALDAIRATQGNNTRRIVMVPAYAAANIKTDFVLPDDPLNSVNKLIWSVHNYDPFNWAHDGVGTYGGVSGLHLQSVRNNADDILSGLPVVLGEWGSIHNVVATNATVAQQETRDAQRATHAGDFVELAESLNMVPVVWDNSGFNNEGDDTNANGVFTGDHKFGLIRRPAPHHIDPVHLNILQEMLGAKFAGSFINAGPALPARTNFLEGYIDGEFSISANVVNGDNSTLSFQWFSNTANSTSGGTAIGAPITDVTTATLTIPTDLKEGRYFYYVVISANGVPSVTSNVAEVRVRLLSADDIGPPRIPFNCGCTISYQVRMPVHGGPTGIDFGADLAGGNSLVIGEVCCDKTYTFSRTFGNVGGNVNVLHLAIIGLANDIGAEAAENLIFNVLDAQVNGVTPPAFNGKVSETSGDRPANFEIALFNSWSVANANVFGITGSGTLSLPVPNGATISVTVEFRGLPCEAGTTNDCEKCGCLSCFPPGGRCGEDDCQLCNPGAPVLTNITSMDYHFTFAGITDSSATYSIRGLPGWHDKDIVNPENGERVISHDLGVPGLSGFQHFGFTRGVPASVTASPPNLPAGVTMTLDKLVINDEFELFPKTGTGGLGAHDFVMSSTSDSLPSVWWGLNAGTVIFESNNGLAFIQLKSVNNDDVFQFFVGEQVDGPICEICNDDGCHECDINYVCNDPTCLICNPGPGNPVLGEMRDITTNDLVLDMGLGINLGNTLEAWSPWLGSNPSQQDLETSWGSPIITREMIEGYKDAGFTTLRVPVAWSNLLSVPSNWINNTIAPYWLNTVLLDRVEKVVNYALDADMYVVLNLHWDGGWMYNFPNHTAASMHRYTRIWEQVAERFMAYGDKLVFESQNEELGWQDLWNPWGASTGANAQGKIDAYALVNAINQKFVDIIRASGGNNPERHLLIAGYNTDVDRTVDPLFQMPNDPAGRMALKVHYYDPGGFALIGTDMVNPWAPIRFTWGTTADIAHLNTQMNKLYNTFINNGIPVVIGEYGVAAQGKSEEEIRNYTLAVTKAMYSRGMLPILWDVQLNDSNPGEEHYYYNRSIPGMVDQLLEEGMKEIAGGSRELKSCDGCLLCSCMQCFPPDGKCNNCVNCLILSRVWLNGSANGWTVSTEAQDFNTEAIIGNGTYELWVEFDTPIQTFDFISIQTEFKGTGSYSDPVLTDFPNLKLTILSFTADDIEIPGGSNSTTILREQGGVMRMDLMSPWAGQGQYIANSSHNFGGAKKFVVTFTVSGIPEKNQGDNQQPAPPQTSAPSPSPSPAPPPANFGDSPGSVPVWNELNNTINTAITNAINDTLVNNPANTLGANTVNNAAGNGFDLVVNTGTEIVVP
ncbi:MAG: glycoside hydrolase family 5 protein, partial [Lachnospiraceae bacterium]|nr:glycoside hydrolase family 5 protein [Lachnospiraceae bacterium]